MANTKKNKMEGIRNLTASELSVKERDVKEQLFKLKLQKATGQLANTSVLRIIRKELARIKTCQSEKTRG
jgi:large subunit ribosomal protein L29